MNAQRCSLLVVSTLTILSLANVPTAYGQARESRPEDFKINRVDARVRRAPNYTASNSALGGQGDWSSKPWLVVEVDFATDLEWTDDIVLKFYVVMGKGKAARMFTGDVILVNVKKGSSHRAAMFMHASTLDRYGQGKVEAVGVQLVHNNRPMAHDSDKGKNKWWEQLSPIPGYLLKPSASPWSVMAHEFFEAEKSAP